jgi:hypothetical protein
MRNTQDCFTQSPYYSLKLNNYFAIYDRLLAPYRDQPITFVEVGVLSGGSLHMWRSFFGPEARIIGVDLNPDARRWEQDGFEIHIGNQQSPAFWASFFEKVGRVDVLLDDGGHTYAQQIITAQEAMTHMEKGLVIVEDTVTSYYKAFGYPFRKTFTEWAKTLVESVNARCVLAELETDWASRNLLFVEFHPSVIALHLDAAKCVEVRRVENEGERLQHQDFRHHADGLGGLKRLAQIRKTYFPVPGFVQRSGVLPALSLFMSRSIQRNEARKAWNRMGSGQRRKAGMT